ncbi:hypothetical protein C6P40_002760 [Pichia californica]|uniref:Ornithine cyclodeaminase n=1 Tax=Pichia californica TaxID=460514 RepID=A0A9P6WHR3_9ASCO|nr:hypothetical protein C6P40_002760 [[Candida] californica]
MLVLTEQVITSLLQNLTQKEAVSYQDTLLAALSEYENDESIIPPRIVTTTPYCTHLFMASTGSHVGMKAITGSREGFKGITTILNKENGYPLGIINCATLTAFRTALCNSLPLVKFYPLSENYNDETLLIFGVGDQAIWHTRLSIILYPNRFSNVVIVNRTISKAELLCKNFKIEYPNINFKSVAIDNKSTLLSEFSKASIVFTCIPTSIPTVTKELVAQHGSKRLFIGAIGSYKPHMTEIEGSVMKDYVISKGNKIVVDSIDHCLHEAGEFIINDIKKDNLIDISSIYSNETNSSFLSSSQIAVSKLVGLCIMDVWVGSRCLEEAKLKGVGIEIDNF